MPTSSPLVHLQGAGVHRQGRWLIRGVDLALARGEIVTLIGPNGSGKSTTAKLALGLIAPDEGSAAQASGMTVGYVPQSVSIDWSMPITVARFLRLTSRLHAREAGDVLDRTGVRHLAGSDVRTLSGGEFQRVLLARAMARKPDLLVLDEPVQGVDFSGEIALYELIGQLRDELGCGVLLISHDLHVVMAATDRVLCLNGHVCCEGSPTSVVASAAYRDLFGPNAAATHAVYVHEHDHEHGPDGRIQPVPGKALENAS
ncbi:MAG: metal ABC transporter ATP-binding protein, partial [Pseudomonadota bacterium]